MKMKCYHLQNCDSCNIVNIQKNRVGDRTNTAGTPKLTGYVLNSMPSIATWIQSSERKIFGGKVCSLFTKRHEAVLDISKAIVRDSPFFSMVLNRI